MDKQELEYPKSILNRWCYVENRTPEMETIELLDTLDGLHQDRELYRNLYNEALYHLEILTGKNKETINKLLWKVVNGK